MKSKTMKTRKKLCTACTQSGKIEKDAQWLKDLYKLNKRINN